MNPLDAAIGIPWPKTGRNGQPITHLLSDKDRTSMSLAQAAAANLLPRARDLSDYIASLARS